jgi:hypothetical protein
MTTRTTTRILAFCISFLILASVAIDTAFAQVPDPGTPGPLAVTREEYNFGDTAFQPSNFPGPVELRASIHYPTALAGPYPVVILLHGRPCHMLQGRKSITTMALHYKRKPADSQLSGVRLRVRGARKSWLCCRLRQL